MSLPEHEDVEPGGPKDTRLSRAQMLRKAMSGLAAAVGVGIAASVGSTKVAKAATNDPTLLGNSGNSSNPNLAEDATEVRYDGAGAPGIVFLAQADNAFSPSNASFPAALGGWTTTNVNVPNGVYGFTVQPGAGVVGVSSGPGLNGVFGWAFNGSPTSIGVRGLSDNGVGGGFSGANRAPINLQPVAVSTPPAAGQTGDLYVTVDGTGLATLWFHTGILGWKQVMLAP